MCFKTMKLIVIRNGPKRTIFVSGELELLQMVLEPYTGRCASKDVETSKGVDCEIPHRL